MLGVTSDSKFLRSKGVSYLFGGNTGVDLKRVLEKRRKHFGDQDAARPALASLLNDAINTCAIRLSYALNKAGAPIQSAPQVHVFKGEPHVVEATARHARPTMASDLYLFRVTDVRKYLTHRYGAGTLIYDGHRPNQFKVPFRGPTQGIIVFEWLGRWADFNASGHADLFRGVLVEGDPSTFAASCIGECYWMPGPMLAYLWEMRP